jgi:hypothetical protein
MKNRILWLGIFSVAMAFLESAVVIYLRKIYYQNGFHLPMVIIDEPVARIEILREAATLFMLISIGILAGQTKNQRFAFFLICFGVWDIFYYIFLKLFLNWPLSVFEPDILFLIPVPWIGPVLAPVILSGVMIATGWLFVMKEKINFKTKYLFFFISGSLIIISSFTYNFKKYLLQNNPNLSDLNTLAGNFPDYNWWLFTIGILFFLIPWGLLFLKNNLQGMTRNS